MRPLVLVRLGAIGGLVNTYIGLAKGYTLSSQRASSAFTRMFGRQSLEVDLN